MPDVTSIDLSSARRREDEDEERLREQAARSAVDPHAALDAEEKAARGDPDKLRAAVLKRQALRRDEYTAKNDPQRADNLDPTSSDARRELDDHIRKGVLDAGGATPPASVPMGTPVLDLAPRAETMTRQQVETQLALTSEAMASPGVMLSPVLSFQLSSRLSELRQRLAALSPPMPDPKTFPDATALWREQGKQQRFVDSPEGKQATPEERDAHARYAERLGNEAEARIRAWEASPQGQEAAKRKLYESIHKLHEQAVCRPTDTVDSLRAQYDKLVAERTPPAPNPDTTIYMGENGKQGTLDQLARKAQIEKFEKAETEANAIRNGPLGAAGSLIGRGLGVSDETRTAMAAFGSLGDQFMLHHVEARGRETQRLSEYQPEQRDDAGLPPGQSIRSEGSPQQPQTITSSNPGFATTPSIEALQKQQLTLGRPEAETARAVEFFQRGNMPEKYWSDTLRGFNPGSRVEVTSADQSVTRYAATPETLRGRWLTETPVSNPVAELALPPSNTALISKQWILPADTPVLRGTCRPLNGQPGGGSQIFIIDPSVLREP
jgi:hypothetical protein